VRVGFFILLAVAIGCFIFAGPIVAFFRKDDFDVIEIGKVALRYQMVIFPLNSFAVLANMMLQSAGKTFRASLLSAARQGLFLVPIVLILPRFIGLTGVQMTQMWGDLCSFIMTIPIVFGFLREMKSEEEALKRESVNEITDAEESGSV
jgi:Na+-driven multidrug efflux pump